MLDTFLEPWLHNASWITLLLCLAVGIGVLGKSADVLVEQATDLSLLLGVPRIIVGATIVSLGTTLPEMIVSVMSAVRGEPDIALGNAVGSVICDTGLILGIGCLMAPPTLHRRLVNQQSIVQFSAGLLLVGACFPWLSPTTVFATGGTMPQFMGWVFLGLLVCYLCWSVASARRLRLDTTSMEEVNRRSPLVRGMLLLVSAILVVMASEVLIYSAIESARRLLVPESIIAATLVAFGTSLPELTVAITAARKGRGDLVLGNIIGADILNVLFVAGAAASATPAGLEASSIFFRLQFPAMLAVLLTLRGSIALGVSKGAMPRWAGFILIGFYLAYLGVSTVVR